MKNRDTLYLLSGITLGVLGIIGVAFANPFVFTAKTENATALATTSAISSYLTPGTGTTTMNAVDTYLTQSSTTPAYGSDGATLLVQYIATTTPVNTAPLLNVRPEISQDGTDWYPMTQELNINATTTKMSPYKDYQFVMATSTSIDAAGSGINSGTSTRFMLSMSIATPLRYVRVKFYVPAGGQNGALWAQIVPRKQTFQ